MNTLDAIKTRRSVRDWTDQEVSDELINKVLEAGRWAPSPLNSNPWHFTIVKNKDTLQKLMPEARHGVFLTKANVVIVVTVDNNAKVDEWLSEHEQHIYSGVCAIENMWLASWDLGLGACWVTLDEKNARETLSIPDNHVLLGSLALGYAANTPKEHIELDRRTLEDMTSYESFGKKK